jgi:hypothetical protein
VPVALPTARTRWRCGACGNLTRFDVVRTLRLREYVHADLTGDRTVEESETLGETVEHVTCRWCGAVDQVELVARPDAGSDAGSDAAPAPDAAP